MVSASDSGARGQEFNRFRLETRPGGCVVFLDKTLNSNSASIHTDVEMNTG